VVQIVIVLEIGQNPRKWCDSNSSTDDYGVIEVVKALGRCTKRSIDTNLDIRLARLSTELAKLGRLVPISLDMQHHLVAATCSR
jgi:hypothetical protein